MLLNHLPDDVLLFILQHCSAQDLSSLSQTCVRFAHLTRLDVIWKALCMKKFSINQLSNNKNFYCLYSQLLHRHGWMIGLFQIQTEFIRGLLEVKYLDGRICGHQLIIPDHSWEGRVTDMYRSDKIKMFEISKDHQLPKCLIGTSVDHIANISKHDDDAFNYQCKHKCKHKYDEDFFRKTHFIFQMGISYKKLSVVKTIPKALKLQDGSQMPQIIKPGFYVGECDTFFPKKRNTLLFSYKDTYEVHGTRVVGPTGGFVHKLIMAIKFDIRHQIFPSTEEQKNMDALVEIKPIKTDITLQTGSEQSFYIPHDFDSFGDEIWRKFPETCKARYHGHAEVNYLTGRSAGCDPVHIVIFDHDHVGILWFKLKKFAIYRRQFDV